MQERTIQAHQSLDGNSKKSHDRQLGTLLPPEPKSIRYPENRQVTVSRHCGFRRKWGSTRKNQYAQLCKLFERCQDALAVANKYEANCEQEIEKNLKGTTIREGISSI